MLHEYFKITIHSVLKNRNLFIVSELVQLTFAVRLTIDYLVAYIYQLQQFFYVALDEVWKTITYGEFERTDSEAVMAISRYYPGTYWAELRNYITHQNMT
jgi:hypothetical protein